MPSTHPSSDEHVLVSIRRACELTSLSRTMINRLRAENRFPAAVPLGEKRIGFVRAEIQEWIAGRIAARRVVPANDNAPARAAA